MYSSLLLSGSQLITSDTCCTSIPLPHTSVAISTLLPLSGIIFHYGVTRSAGMSPCILASAVKFASRVAASQSAAFLRVLQGISLLEGDGGVS
jgi:hypothetical protein